MGVLLIAIALVSALVLWWLTSFTNFKPLSFSVLSMSSCELAEFYVDQQVIYDDSKREGHIEQVQEKVAGQKEHCHSYLSSKTTTTILRESVPSVVRVGTMKYKDPNLMAIAHRSGIIELPKNEPVSVYYVDNYTDFLWSAGQYSDIKKAITVKSSIPLKEQSTILSHEYLHYVWSRDGLGNNQALVDALVKFYDQSPDLQSRMVDYSDDMKQPTEYFSYGCTEWGSNRIGLLIESYCAKYIDRSKMSILYR